MKTYIMYNNYNEILPEIGVEVIAFNSNWIDEDFNPNGTRVGFRTDDNDFISAHYWHYHGEYITICNNECENNEEYSEEIRNNIYPEKWMYIPKVSVND